MVLFTTNKENNSSIECMTKDTDSAVHPGWQEDSFTTDTKEYLEENDPALVIDSDSNDDDLPDEDDLQFDFDIDDKEDDMEQNVDRNDSNNEDNSFTPKIVETSGCDENTPIFEGSSLTLSVSIMLIMTFVMRHHISGVALIDLLSLIEVHMVSNNIFQTSIKFIRKAFTRARGAITLHYFCRKCLTYVGKEDIECNVCMAGTKNNGYFVMTVSLIN
uniref:Uncharacterized protein n=1 Tax=Clytia hemisphaerica TaxID=252671 RepID=A0A7M5V4G6_9CNID